MLLLSRRLDRYVLAEVLSPTLMGFLVFTSILLVNFLFRSADMIIRRDVPIEVVGKLLLLTMPNIVVLTIPMSFLFGILVAVGRLSSDSELIAMRSAGVSLLGLYRPILLLSGALFLVNTYASVDLLPWGNRTLVDMRTDLIAHSISKEIEPRIFYEDWQGITLYIFEAPPDEDVWTGVFLAEDATPREHRVTVAEAGRLWVEEENARLVLELDDAITHQVNLTNTNDVRYDVSSSRKLSKLLPFPPRIRPPGVRDIRSMSIRELNLAELWEIIQDPDSNDFIRRSATVELHKKFSIPASCLVFGLLGLPLGYTSGRSSRSSSFAISIVVFLLYYVMLNHGEEAAFDGTYPPWLSMWAPNILLALAGLYLLLRRNRDRGLQIGAVNRWLQETVWQRVSFWRSRRDQRRQQRRNPAGVGAPSQPRPGARRADVILRLPRPRLRFPNLLDRYILRLFTWIFCIATGALISVYIIGDLSGLAENIRKNNVGADVVIAYYQFMSLDIFYQIAPLIVLITVLLTFALLSHSSEVTAAKSLGVSLYRLSLPAVFAAGVVALLCGLLTTSVLPASNQKVAQLKDEIRARVGPRSYQNNWSFGEGRRIYHFVHFDPRRQELQHLQVFEFDEEYRLTRRLFSASARFVNDAWVFTNAWVRSFDGRRITGYDRYTEPVVGDFPETPDFFEAEVRGPEQMAYGELREHIRQLKNWGQSVPELEVSLYAKVAQPALALIMGLVALPFAFRIGRRGALYGFGTALVLGMAFMGVFAFFIKLGEIGALPAILAVWAPGIAFSMYSGYLFLGVRT